MTWNPTLLVIKLVACCGFVTVMVWKNFTYSVLLNLTALNIALALIITAGGLVYANHSSLRCHGDSNNANISAVKSTVWRETLALLKFGE